MVQIYDVARRQFADEYTSHPAGGWDEATWARMAEQAEMTVEVLRKHLHTPHIEMTCPLCGRPQTHLVGCQGCGGDAWGYECEMVHGEGFKEQLREHLHSDLAQAKGVTPEQVEHAVRHAYALGGCMVCADCWRDK